MFPCTDFHQIRGRGHGRNDQNQCLTISWGVSILLDIENRLLPLLKAVAVNTAGGTTEKEGENFWPNSNRVGL